MTTEEFIAEWESDASFIEAHTSGSTGTPKLIRLPKRLVADSAWRSIRHFGLDANSRLHLCLSPDYIAGKMVIVRALLSGAALTVETPSSEPLSGLGQGDEISLLSVVGTQVKGLMRSKMRGALPHIRHLLVGGAPLTEQVAADALRVGEHVWESYGMTETASHIALREIFTPEDVGCKPFEVLSGIEVGIDPRGCLVVTLPGEESLVTNDVCRMSGERRFSILGRADNAIITGGLKVHPEQVEKRIEHLLHAYPAFFIGSKPDEKWGRRVVLVLESGRLTADAESALLRECAALLAVYERPREIVTLPQLPRTSSGKIIRRL